MRSRWSVLLLVLASALPSADRVHASERLDASREQLRRGAIRHEAQRHHDRRHQMRRADIRRAAQDARLERALARDAKRREGLVALRAVRRILMSED